MPEPDPVGRDFLDLQEALTGRYSIERELGRGGMGVVYLAHEIALDRPVALKLLPPAYAVQPSLRERFLREARTAAKLSHPHIVPIHAVDEVEGFVFFAMAYIDGETLGERVRSKGPLLGGEAARVLRDVAWALAYAHAEGVIHRDVKPDNILLETGSGRALVSDFGIAHLRAEPGITQADQVLGTAEFMSPEQAAGEDVGEASDLYSLGCVGFYALTGRMPFEGASTAAVLAKHLTQPPPRLADLAPGAPGHLVEAVERCLRKSPDERFADGAALAEALSQNLAAQRELPVPLRIFVNKTRGLASATPLLLVLYFVIALIPLLANASEWPAVIFAILSLSFVLPLGALWVHARRLLTAGYSIGDARLALEQDLERRTEEIRFEFGKGLTWVDHVLRWLAGGGFGAALVAVVAGVLGLGSEFFLGLGLIGWNVGLYSFFGAAFRNKRRRDFTGESLRSLFGGRIGDWIFRLGSVGLAKGAIRAGGAHRPTEMAIGIAADELFDALPRELRRELSGLPDAIEDLEAGARKMRRQVEELTEALAALREGPAGVVVEESKRLRKDLEAGRDAAKARMMDAISALETIRLGLLRLHAGEGDVRGLTVELGSADELAAAIRDLIEGQKEVTRVLKGPRPGEPTGPAAPEPSEAG